MATRIRCDAYDYFEIICMRRSWVLVTTRQQQEFQGNAINIINNNGVEELLIDDHGTEHKVNLAEIKQLQALNNHNLQHNFSVEW